ncbi:hypothetical protein BKI52_13905 [marine bacterium AO1-C]|nr:hypothetical protein BKI52_13905 [marine bacterium AO1-C]
MKNTINALLVTKGHAFQEIPFFSMIDDLGTWDDEVTINWKHVKHPKALAAFEPARTDDYDVVVFYDMPGVVFTNNPAQPFQHAEPPAEFKKNFMDLVDKGKGMVFIHHAIGGWPTWKEYTELIGGKFQFMPGEVGGKNYPGSGYRFYEPQTISVLDTSHPIVEGLGTAFKMRDEVYLYPVLEDDVVPLLRSDFNFVSENFANGGLGFKEHPKGSDLIAWVRASGKSPIAYLQPGHGPQIYSDNNYKRLIVNAIKWANSEEAYAWAEEWVSARAVVQ